MTITTENRLPFLFASILTAYPDNSFTDNVKILLEDIDVKDSCSRINKDLWLEIENDLSNSLNDENKFVDLASDYIDLFDRGNSLNSPYESDYGQNQAMSKGFELGDLSGFYRAFGLETDGDGLVKEMLDHISLELEFYAYLLMKLNNLENSNNVEGIEIVNSARKKFINDHLGRFACQVASRPGIVSHPLYSKIFTWCKDLVDRECKLLEVEPIRATFFGSKETEEHSCGTLGNCVADILNK